MLLLTAFAAAALSTAPSGPAIMVIRRTTGTVFVQFSSFERCEDARRTFEQFDAEARRKNAESGYTTVPGTEPTYHCIPG